MSLSESDDGASAYEPVWVPDGEAAACTECQSQFTIFNRRHHCRLCGHIFCTQCSSSRVTAITGIQDSTHHRLCGDCIDALQQEQLVVEVPAAVYNSRQSLFCGLHQPSQCRVFACIDPSRLVDAMLEHPSASRRGQGICGSAIAASDAGSVLEECPACSKNLGRMGREKAQLHVNGCLNTRRGSVVGDRYTVNELTESIAEKECGICYEPFLAGQAVVLLNCLCQFHRACIDKWFKKGKTCPFHYE